MPNTSVSRNVCWYLSGYADGEGSFCVSFSPRNKLRSKLEVRPSFSVSQNADRSEVLSLFQQILGCGTIRPDRSDKTLKFEIRSLSELVEKVIPFFEKYHLMSSKRKDFSVFSQICHLMNEGNKSKSELEHIIRLAMKMNVSGKRKYNTHKLISIL
ncbi:MAG: LAGLIDADG homing endonuclease [Candidatus Amesbacteria bacterium GW2011_GWB1_47_19]|nr:MAG: LAGLIDADG homing endonuclease [Candidatus Amesbacteria bacterium GW2011_GWC1_46_24]KKU66849.1 MAG: LAGLIDADG homing endonuclease [Candidatus Amesbacteria bacterium GW2011_GWB1_47_19]OGD05614.1 MAG: hypothetical protein A2379_00280 [Candidatus Amesbacteria bacterium RIFOXYB1_FULL_47_13]